MITIGQITAKTNEKFYEMCRLHLLYLLIIEDELNDIWYMKDDYSYTCLLCNISLLF